MELRDLEYFLAIIREGSLTGAARALHLSQPGITRSLKALEDELGKQLIVRGSRRIVLTEEGMILRRRAEEILALSERARSEVLHADDVIEGDIYICAGETRGLRFITRRAAAFIDRHPGVCLHLSSGDRTDVREELEKGLADLGLLLEPLDSMQYYSLPIPYEDTWGVIMRKDWPLASQTAIRPEDLIGEKLIMPRGVDYSRTGSRILGLGPGDLHVTATYSLLFNASLMAADGIGYVIGLDRILKLTDESTLCFRPLDQPVTARMNIVWKRYQPLSHQAQAFLRVLQGKR